MWRQMKCSSNVLCVAFAILGVVLVVSSTVLVDSEPVQILTSHEAETCRGRGCGNAANDWEHSPVAIYYGDNWAAVAFNAVEADVPGLDGTVSLDVGTGFWRNANDDTLDAAWFAAYEYSGSKFVPNSSGSYVYAEGGSYELSLGTGKHRLFDGGDYIIDCEGSVKIRDLYGSGDTQYVATLEFSFEF